MSTTFKFRIDEALLKSAGAKARECGKTISDVIREFLGIWTSGEGDQERPGQVEIKSPRKAATNVPYPSSESRESLGSAAVDSTPTPTTSGRKPPRRGGAQHGESGAHAERVSSGESRRGLLAARRPKAERGPVKSAQSDDVATERENAASKQSGPPQTKSKACSECGALRGHQKWCSKK